MFRESFNRYLGGEMYMDDHKRKVVVSSLIQEMSGRGIKNVDLSELTGWSTSKISKLLSGKQAFTDDDLRVWARALGYTLDPFLDHGVDLRGYDIRKYVRSPMDCIDRFCEADEEDPEYEAILNIELPLAILGVLGVRISDYAVRTHVSSGYGNKEEDECSWIKFWNRNTKDSDLSLPIVSLWIDGHRDGFALIVYLDGNLNNLAEEVAEVRATMTGMHNDIDFLRKEDANHHWLPAHIVDRAVSFDYWGKDFPQPDEDFFEESLGEVFKDYCDIVWELRHIDLIPGVAIFSEPNTSIQMSLWKSLVTSSRDAFKKETVAKVLSEHDYKCEIDPDHKTFLTAAGHQYVEAVPLIKLDDGLYLGKGIFEAANILCLCPICAAKLEHGLDEEREGMFIGLHRSHKKALEEVGVKISLGQLLKMYKL